MTLGKWVCFYQHAIWWLFVIFGSSDGQGFASCEGCAASEGIEAANVGDNGAGDGSVGNRRDHGAFHRRGLRQRWEAGVQGLAVLRGPLRPHSWPHRNPELASPENPQSRNGHARRKNAQRSRGCCRQRTQHRIHQFPSELAQVLARQVQFQRQIETSPWPRPKANVLSGHRHTDTQILYFRNYTCKCMLASIALNVFVYVKGVELRRITLYDFIL